MGDRWAWKIDALAVDILLYRANALIDRIRADRNNSTKFRDEQNHDRHVTIVEAGVSDLHSVNPRPRLWAVGSMTSRPSSVPAADFPFSINKIDFYYFFIRQVSSMY